MKATELRIGNWVRIKDVPTTKEWQVESIGNLQQVAGQLWSIEELEPIQLTEEWLTRFGFKLPAHSWIGDKFHLSEYGEGSKHPNGGVWVVAMNKNNAIISEIQYVHQLQNLYFALTGKELQTDETEKKVNQ